MKVLQVPHIHLDNNLSAVEKMVCLKDKGAKAEIDVINWRELFPKHLQAEVFVAHTNTTLVLLYDVKDELVRASATHDFENVWEDSCVEFFVQREGEKTYRNFECNILGTLLASQRENRNDAQRLTSFMPLISRFSTIQPRITADRHACDWTMFIEIPKEALGFAETENLSEQTLRANFYKCGDNTPEPHYLSWNPIDVENPNFHLPEFFGKLILE